jgi:hypothetical protein
LTASGVKRILASLMRAILPLPLPALILLAFLVACDPRSEEEVSLAPAVDQSPAGIIERIREAEKSITSLREDRTHISTQQAAPTGESDTTPQETTSIRIQVGEDSYTKYEFIQPDLCDYGFPCEDIFSPLDENLFYNGDFYYRDRSGTGWVTEPAFGCPGDDQTIACLEGSGGFIGVAYAADCPALESIGEIGPSRIYSFDFSWLKDPEQVEDDSDGSGLTHIRAVIDQPSWPFGLSPEIEAAYAECGIDSSEFYGEQEIPAEIRANMPDRLKGIADIWVDPVTFFVHRIDWSLDMFNGDRLIQSDKTIAQLSLFNEAELPGPLPE